jgi:hypothetical protein
MAMHEANKKRQNLNRAMLNELTAAALDSIRHALLPGR